MATEFTFRFSVSAELRKSYPALYRVLFGRTADWEKALGQVYGKSKSGNKSYHRYISNFLQGVFKKALHIWLENAWNLGEEYKEKGGEHLAIFDQRTSSKRGPQPDPRLALWAAKRFNKLVPVVKDLRSRFMEKQQQMKEQALIDEIEKRLSYETVRRALGKLLGEQSRIGPRELFTREVKTGPIIHALIECEMGDRGVTIGRVSLKKHIRLGSYLLKALADVARP